MYTLVTCHGDDEIIINVIKVSTKSSVIHTMQVNNSVHDSKTGSLQSIL